MIETFRDSWLSHLAPYLRFVWRWGWFLLLSMLVPTVISLLLPDAPASTSYQATLKIQVILPLAQNTAVGMDTSTKFYAALFTSPATISLLLPEYHGETISDLQPLILATPVATSSIVELSASGDSAHNASQLVTDIYSAALKELQDRRSNLTNSLTIALNNELTQSKQDAQNSLNQLQNLAAAHLTATYAYLEQESLYHEELQRVDAVNQAIQVLNQQGFRQNSILKPLDATPMMTTMTQISYTQHQRIMLSPIVGLLMGLGGILLASTFSTRLPLRGKRRDMLFSGIITTMPIFSGLRSNRLLVLQQTSPCTTLLRHLQYQAREYEVPLNLITVTSPKRHEGKSIAATSLALAAAQSGLRTLLIDAHPQHPILHHWFHLPNEQGLLNSLRHRATSNPALPPVMRTFYQNVSLLPIGNSDQAASILTEDLPIDALRTLKKQLLTQADIVIFDGPPLLDDANATHLAQISDATVLVVDAQRSQSTWIIQAENLLSVLGVSSATLVNRTDADAVE